MNLVTKSNVSPSGVSRQHEQPIVSSTKGCRVAAYHESCNKNDISSSGVSRQHRIEATHMKREPNPDFFSYFYPVIMNLSRGRSNATMVSIQDFRNPHHDGIRARGDTCTRHNFDALTGPQSTVKCAACAKFTDAFEPGARRGCVRNRIHGKGRPRQRPGSSDVPQHEPRGSRQADRRNSDGPDGCPG